MQIFGDPGREDWPTADALATLRADLLAFEDGTDWLERHARLVSLFIDLAELAQSIADDAFARAGHDAANAASRTLASRLTALAGLVCRSWAGSLPAGAVAATAADRWPAMAGLPEAVRPRRSEGYAFYAVYPEAFAAAAVRLAPARRAAIIGVRSIGLGLAAMVAAALSAPPPLSVRPVGDPFRRRIELAPALVARLRAAPGPFAIVDEGPGLSGSSFAAVAGALERIGVPAASVHFFPSHAGEPGPAATPAVLRHWRGKPRHLVDFDALVLRAGPERRLQSWFADLTGEAAAPVDLSGGRWRRALCLPSRAWPPVHAWQERRKYLLSSPRGQFLARFAGLGRYGADVRPLSLALAGAGFVPASLGLRHGFHLEPWLAEARPLDLASVDRAALIVRIASYLSFRARSFPAEPAAGASATALIAMVETNAGEALGTAWRGAMAGWRAHRADLERRMRRVRTDNRMHRWEWLVLPSGRLIKTDAVDHHAGHDLVGCQDIAWDVAGAIVEFDLDDDEADLLGRAMDSIGARVDPRLLAFLLPCYLAFWAGYYAVAAGSAAEPDEAGRLRAAAATYADALRRRLGRSGEGPGLDAPGGSSQRRGRSPPIRLDRLTEPGTI